MSLLHARLQAELQDLYSSPDRHYHGVAHVEALLALAREWRPALDDPEAVEAAIWFHDAIYDSRDKDNEAKSAALAREKLAGLATPGRIDLIAAMIEATATHRPPDLGDHGANRDAALFLDMDLAILGAEPAAFDAYEAAVRREYAWVPDPQWATGRHAVLSGFLARPSIFNTSEFHDRYERKARDNIARSIAALA